MQNYIYISQSLLKCLVYIGFNRNIAVSTTKYRSSYNVSETSRRHYRHRTMYARTQDGARAVGADIGRSTFTLPVGGHFELTNPTKGFYIHILYGCQWCSNFVPVDPPFVLPYASIPAACATLCTALNSLTLQNIVQATCIWYKFETSVCTVGRVKFDSLSFTCLCRWKTLVYSA